MSERTIKPRTTPWAGREKPETHCLGLWLQGRLHRLRSLSSRSHPRRSWPGRPGPSLWSPRRGNTPTEDGRGRYQLLIGSTHRRWITQAELYPAADFTDIDGIVVAAATSVSIFVWRIFPRLNEKIKLNQQTRHILDRHFKTGASDLGNGTVVPYVAFMGENIANVSQLALLHILFYWV